jgi:lipoprotein-releasing system permease protein
MLGSGLYHTMDWEELNHGLFTALRIQQIGMSAVLALIILVAAFTVVATLIMVVLDKTKEIAVMKAMGATDSSILRIFLYQGGIIGLVGTGLGLLLGLAVCKGLLVYGFPLDPKVYFISRLPVQVRPQEFLLTGEVALAICLEATIIPALYAAGLSPVEGFREQIGASEGPRRRPTWFTVWLFYLQYANTVMVILTALILQMGGDTVMPRAWIVSQLVMCAGVAICALGLLSWQRWGFYGMCVLYGLDIAAGLLVIPVALSRWGVAGGMLLTGFAVRSAVVLAVTYLGMRPQWRYFA